MSKTLERVPAVDLDALWNHGDHDLELSDDGQIRPVRQSVPERPSRAVSGALRAIGAAAPIAAGAVISSIEEISRWD